MFNLKKAMVAGATFVLAAGIIAPFGVSSVADAATDIGFEYVESVASDTISLVEGDYTITTKIGSKEIKDVYEGVGSIDISYLAGKAADITIAKKGKEKTDTFKVAAQAKKVKAKFDPKTYSASLEVDGQAVTEGVQARIGSKENIDISNLEKYTVKGATLYLSKAEDSIDKTGETTYTPVSKEAKVKIPAKKNGPKVTIDPKKFTFKLAKGCEYWATAGDETVSEAAAAAKTVSMADVNKLLANKSGSVAKTDGNNKYCEVSKDITFKFYKSATDKAMKSKATVVEVPAQAEVNGDELISCEVTFNSKKTEATGIAVKNTTNSAIEFMVVAKDTDLSKIDLAAKTTKWTTLKKNGNTKKISAKKLTAGDFLIVRVAGQKANAKQNIEFALASQISTSGAVIALPAKVTNDLGATIAAPTTADGASKAAITVSSKTSGATYKYEVGTKEVKTFEIGKAAPGSALTDPAEGKGNVAAKKGDWITVYEEVAGKVVKFKSLKVEASHLK